VSKSRFQSVLIALSLAAGLGTANIAQAGLYKGIFDPTLFMGFAYIDVPLACQSTGTGWIDTSSCGGVDFVSATVTPQGTVPAGQDQNDEIAFGFVADGVTGLWWDNGVLAGIDTGIVGVDSTVIGPGFSDADLPFGNSNGYYLQFSSGHAGNPEIGTDPSVLLFECLQQEEDAPTYFHTSSLRFPTFSSVHESCTEPQGCNFSQIGDPATQDPFVPVPEPGSLALVLGAVTAGLLARRRMAKA